MYNLSIPKKKLFEKDTRVGIVDIGSDTIRFQIFENFKNNQIPIFNKKISCGLGKDLASTNELNKNSIKKAIKFWMHFEVILEEKLRGVARGGESPLGAWNSELA